jgi:hypothetical protein
MTTKVEQYNRRGKTKLETVKSPSDVTDAHTGKRGFIRGGGRSADIGLAKLEDHKTQNWDKLVDEWIDKH